MVVGKAAFPDKTRTVLPPPRFCGGCGGAGWRGYRPDGSSIECERCHGWGQAADPGTRVPVLYTATSLADTVDVGLDLPTFVCQLLEDWPSVDSDLVVWRQQGAGEDVRLTAVAVIHPGADGRSALRWL